MRLFIDEDSVETQLLKLLRQAGHDLITTFDAGLAGEADARQLTRAVDEQRVLLTHNYDVSKTCTCSSERAAVRTPVFWSCGRTMIPGVT